MKNSESNNELIKTLEKNGFIETTSKEDKIQGKKSFKLSKQARKEVYFNYDNIIIINRNPRRTGKIDLTERGLRLLMLYFKLTPSDCKEIDLNGQFDFNTSTERLESLEQELTDLKHFNIQRPRQNKLSRILEEFNSIELN